MLITVAIIAMVASLIAQVFFTTTHANTKSEVMKEVKQNGDFALDVMTRMIRNSIAVTSDCSGSASNSLDIQNPDGGITTFGCSFDNTYKVSRIASSSAVPGHSQFLTSSNVSLGGSLCPGSLLITCISSSYSTDKIIISFQLAQRGTPSSQFEQAQMPFQVTVSPRN